MPEDRPKADDEGRLFIALRPGAAIQAQASFGVGNVAIEWSNLKKRSPREEWFEEAQSQSGGSVVWKDLDKGSYIVNSGFTGSNAPYRHLELKCDLKEGEQKDVMLGANMGFYSLSGQVTQEDGSPLTGGWVGLRPEFEWQIRSDNRAISRVRASDPIDQDSAECPEMGYAIPKTGHFSTDSNPDAALLTSLFQGHLVHLGC